MNTPTDFQVKQCSKCKQVKPVSAFAYKRAGQGTLQPYCRECNTQYQRDYAVRKRELRKMRRENATAAEMDAISLRDRARRLARAALAEGVITLQPCEVCGTTDNIEMHHDDYEQPLKVRCFCPTHHNMLHRNERRGFGLKGLFEITRLMPLHNDTRAAL